MFDRQFRSRSSHRFVKATQVFVFAFSLLFAHTTLNGQVLKSEEVDIVKSYKPLLADAVKIPLQAELPPIDTSMDAMKYDIREHLIEVPFIPAEIKPVSLPEERQAPVQNNLIKAGFGTQLSPVLEIYLGNGKSEKVSYGLDFSYLSSNGSKLKFQDMNHLGGSLFGTSFFKNTALSGKVSYARDVYHFYGFDEDYLDTVESFTKDNLEHRFQDVGVDLAFRNTRKTKSDIGYEFDFGYYNLDENAGSLFNGGSENHFSFSSAINKQIQKVHRAGIELGYEGENFESLTDTSIQYFSVIPNYGFEGEKLWVKAGLHFNIVDEEILFYPRAEVSYKVIGDYLIPYLGVEGGSEAVTMKQVAETNPFVANFFPFTTERITGYGGVKGSYANNISYSVRLGYSHQSNIPFYLPSGANPVYFVVLPYEDGTILDFHAEINYRQSERLNILLSGNASSWDLDFDDQPLGVPKNKMTLRINYNIQDKIIFTTDLFAQSGAYTVIPGDTVQTQLKGVGDLNFSLTYNYKENISIWAALNNVTGAKQREWYHYPSYGFRAFAGLMLKF